MNSDSPTVYSYCDSLGFKRKISGYAGQAAISGVGFCLLVLFRAFVMQDYSFGFTGAGVLLGLMGGLVCGVRPFLWWLIVRNERTQINDSRIQYFNLVNRKRIDCPISEIKFVRRESSMGDWFPATFVFSDGANEFRILGNIGKASELFSRLGTVAPVEADKGRFV